MDGLLNKPGFLRLWFTQLLAALFLAALFLLTVDARAGYSALLGGLVGIIPNLCFATQLFKYQGARAARQIVSNFYKGEALKIVLSIALFSAVFVFFRITAYAFFMAYIAIQIVHWFAPYIMTNKLNGPERD